MGKNTNLTRDEAVELLKGFDVVCPKCGEVKLVKRWMKSDMKKQHIGTCEYKCPSCGELYSPIHLI